MGSKIKIWALILMITVAVAGGLFMMFRSDTELFKGSLIKQPKKSTNVFEAAARQNANRERKTAAGQKKSFEDLCREAEAMWTTDRTDTSVCIYKKITYRTAEDLQKAMDELREFGRLCTLNDGNWTDDQLNQTAKCTYRNNEYSDINEFKRALPPARENQADAPPQGSFEEKCRHTDGTRWDETEGGACIYNGEAYQTTETLEKAVKEAFKKLCEQSKGQWKTDYCSYKGVNHQNIGSLRSALQEDGNLPQEKTPEQKPAEALNLVPALEKTVPSPIIAGQRTVFHVSVTNPGPADAPTSTTTLQTKFQSSAPSQPHEKQTPPLKAKETIKLEWDNIRPSMAGEYTVILCAGANTQNPVCKEFKPIQVVTGQSREVAAAQPPAPAPPAPTPATPAAPAPTPPAPTPTPAAPAPTPPAPTPPTPTPAAPTPPAPTPPTPTPAAPAPQTPAPAPTPPPPALTCEQRGKYTYTGPSRPGVREHGECINCPTNIYVEYGGTCTPPAPAPPAPAQPAPQARSAAEAQPARTQTSLAAAAPTPAQRAPIQTSSPAPQPAYQPAPAAPVAQPAYQPAPETREAAAYAAPAVTPNLYRTQRLVRAPERGNTGPETLLYFGIVAAIQGGLWIRKKLKK